MTLPSSWPFPTREQFLKDPISYLDVMYRSLSDEIYAPSWRLNATLAVPPGATSIAVAANIDRLPYQVAVSVDWGTTTWITLKTVTGFTVNFGTAAPGGGGNLDWSLIQPEAGPA